MNNTPRNLSLLFLSIIPVALAKDPEPFEAEVAKMEATDKQSPPPKGGVLFLGSSSIRAWDLPAAFPGRAVINRGFGGSTFPDATRLVPRLVTPHAPKIVVLYSGDNDLKNGRTPEQVVEDWRALVVALQKAVPDVEVVTIGIKPSPSRWNLIEKTRAANAAIEAAVKKDKRQRFVGVEKAMLGADGKPRTELYLKDGLHLTEAGYEVWTTLLEPVIDELVSGKGRKKPQKEQGGPDKGKPKDPFQALIGKTVAEAQAWLKANPTPSPDHPGTNVTMVRPIRIDGEDQLMTMDLRGDRVNVVVVNGKITEIDGVR